MQKQYVISHTEPAMEIAFHLAHRSSVHEVTPRQRRCLAASDSTEGHSSRNAITVPPRSASPDLLSLTRDPGGSDTVNFPFAFTVYIILSIGLIMLACGITALHVSLAVTGFLITLVGTLLHGLSLCDDLP